MIIHTFLRWDVATDVAHAVRDGAQRRSGLVVLLAALLLIAASACADAGERTPADAEATEQDKEVGPPPVALIVLSTDEVIRVGEGATRRANTILRWAPDRDLVAAADAQGVWLLGLDGTSTRVWSGDAASIDWMSAGLAVAGVHGVVILTPEGEVLHELSTRPATIVAADPAGERVLYQDSDGLHVWDSERQRTWDAGRAFPGPRWLTDGRVAAVHSSQGAVQEGPSRIWAFRPEDSLPDPVEIAGDVVALSTDGAVVLVSEGRDTILIELASNEFVGRWPGTPQTAVSTTIPIQPFVANARTFVLFVRQCTSAPAGVHVVSASQDPEAIWDGQPWTWLRFGGWSPNGSALAWVEAAGKLWISEGGAARLVPVDVFGPGGVAWAANEKAVAVVRGAGGSSCA